MPRAKQRHLDGMEPPSIESIDSAADDYVEARDERMKRSVKEKEAKDTLIEAMGQAGVDYYKTPDGLEVRLTSKAGVKVKKEGSEDGEEEDAD